MHYSKSQDLLDYLIHNSLGKNLTMNSSFTSYLLDKVSSQISVTSEDLVTNSHRHLWGPLSSNRFSWSRFIVFVDEISRIADLRT